MKIAFFELEGWENDIITAAFPADEIFFYKEKLENPSSLDRKDFDAISVFVNSPVSASALDVFPSLKLVTTRSTGFDHVDVAACKSKNIIASFVPGYGDNTVAEFAFSLILNLTRKMYQAIDRLKETGAFSFAGLRGVDLKGRTLGVIGTGRIGKEAIKIGKGFGMNIVAYDPFPNAEVAKEMGFEYAALEDVLKRADIVTIHCPYTPQTHHLINKTNIGLMKKGAYLVNTARGGIVETDALVWALQQGILDGVGLDVLEEEGEIKDELKFLSEAHPNEAQLRTVLENHALLRMPNVLITPHNAFNTQEALMRILNTTIANINGFKAGTPQNQIPGSL